VGWEGHVRWMWEVGGQWRGMVYLFPPLHLESVKNGIAVLCAHFQVGALCSLVLVGSSLMLGVRLGCSIMFLKI